MMEQKRLMIFPYNWDAISLIRNQDKITEYDLVVVCSFKEDRNVIDYNLNKDNLILTVDFENVLEEVQAVLFCDNLLNIDLNGYVSKLTEAFNRGKEIILSEKLYYELLNVSEEISVMESKMKIIRNFYQKKPKEVKRILYPIETPVVCIFGFGEDCDKFNTHIAFSNILEDQGYTCLNIYSNSLGKILGGEVLPSFMYSDKISLCQKTQLFNSYVFDLNRKHNSDIIVISSPYGIMPRNIYISNKFGEIPLIISNAVNIDMGILCIDFVSDVSDYYIEELRKLMQYKFSTSLGALCVSGVKKRFRFDDREQESYYLSPNCINNIKDFTNKDNIFYSFDKKNQNKCLNNIIYKLENNAKIF